MTTPPLKRSSKPASPVGLLPGYKDRLPQDVPYWDYVVHHIERVARDYSFLHIETPIVEDARLFSALTDAPTDASEVVTFEDADGTRVALRPENTIPLARAYREHGFTALPQPVKVYSLGPQFRREKPGAGRLRQFTQFNLEVFGDLSPVVDAQLIAAVYFFLSDFRLDFRLHLNSVGHPECRAAYERLLTEFYRTKRSALCDECKARLAKQPLHLLVCHVPECQEIAQEAPPIVDHLCEEDREHFVRVLEHLDEVQVSYVLDPRLFREKAYYNRTVVEFFTSHGDGRSIALAGGGRYDSLIATLGGEPTPGLGIAVGIERVITAMKEQGIAPPETPAPDVYLTQIGDEARKKSLRLFLELRNEGIKVAESLSKEGIKAQLEAATKVHAQFALILGQKEIMDGTILLRDMENGIQEVIDFQKIIPEVKKRLQKLVAAGEKNNRITPPQPPVSS